MPEPWSLSQFAGQVGATFRVAPAPGAAPDLELIEATALKAGAEAGPRAEPFALVFRGPGSPALAQQIYTLDHPDLGAFEVFLVPIGPEGDPLGTHYQAVFH